MLLPPEELSYGAARPIAIYLQVEEFVGYEHRFSSSSIAFLIPGGRLGVSRW